MLVVVLPSLLGAAAAAAPPTPPHHILRWEQARIRATDPVAGVTALASRLLGPTAASGFEFEALPAAPSASFELGSNGGKPVLRGSSGTALSAALYHYLKYYANCSVRTPPHPAAGPQQPLWLSGV